MEQRFRRITIADQGIRKKPGLLFDGEGFDLSWDAIEGWATVGAFLVRSSDQRIAQPFAQFLELHYKNGLHTVGGSDVGKGNFDRLVQLVRERLPGKQVNSFIEQMQEMRRRQNP